MLENLRRKSLVKTYHDPIHQVCFEQGLAKYGKHIEIDVCTQKLSKELQENLFQKAIDTISKEGFSFFKLTMIYCPKGTFTMGHIDQEDNQPRKKKIDRPFLLGETEITQELYEKVMGENPSLSQNDSQKPVEWVSWVDAILFCNELSRLQGLDECYTENPKSRDHGWDCDFSKNGYRLPEEKEWEYAAKAGTENKYAGTNQLADLSKYAWFREDWQTGTTHPVKTKKPNEWGFYDMSGNVREWCWDKYDPKDRDISANRVIRGGSCGYDASHLRSARRFGNSPDYCSDGGLGFRVCRSFVN